MNARTPDTPPRRTSRGRVVAAIVGAACVACCAVPWALTAGLVAGTGGFITGGVTFAAILSIGAALGRPTCERDGARGY